jgi:hypothetical protein
MKRFSVLFAAAALFSAITGCQKESAGKQEANEADVYIQYTINFEDGMTKADYNSDAVSVGTDAEHTVKNAYIYFFDKDNKYVKTVAIAAGDITSAAVEGNIVKKTTVPTKLEPGTYSVYATINYEVSMGTGKTTSDFAESVYTHDYTTYKIDVNGIPMSSRAADGTLCQTNVVVDSYNTFENPVQIQLFMERMVAKLTVKTKESNDFTVKTERDGTGDDLATVTLKSYKPVNLTQNAYLYRHVGTAADATTFGDLTAENYVIEPETAGKVKGATGLNYYNPINGTEAYTTMPAAKTFTTPMYCTENTMFVDNQLKTFATGYAFKAQITPAAGKYFAKSGENIAAGTYTSGNDLWYFGGNFYDSLESLNAHNGLSLSANAGDSNYYKRFGAKCFVDGICYYNYYIRHFNNIDPQKMGIMEYAIVRNNDYQVTVTGIVSLGDDVPTVTEEEEIESEMSYFQATLLVRPWVVRAQNAVLG